ncbi:MAG: dihydroxyacetone kinase subunit DhaL [Spirochaetota bacterium]
MERLCKKDILSILYTIRKIMEDNKEFLIQLDSTMGDGDLGLTMTKAFIAADEELKKSEESDIGKLLMKAGTTIAKAAPSTMGTLVATGFMRGGKALSGKENLTTSDLADFFQAFVNGVMERGKAKPGEKTIIDALKPAADALSAAILKTPREALSDALAAAEKGLEATKNMIARHGRIAYYQEQAKGKQDPGATAGVFIVKGFYEGGDR